MDQPDLFHQVCPRCDLLRAELRGNRLSEWIAEHLPDEDHRLIAGDLDDTRNHHGSRRTNAEKAPRP